jgi:hypothetical protein
MWAWLFVAIGAFAGVMTWAFAVRESAVIFTTAMSTVSWSLLAIQSELELVDGGGRVALELGGVRWLLAALALLSMLAMIGSVLGQYPDTHPEQEFTET